MSTLKVNSIEASTGVEVDINSSLGTVPSINVSGTLTATNAVITGDLTVQGTTTTLDTNLVEVDRVEVGANSSNPGIAVTQSGAGPAAYFNGSVGIGTDDPTNGTSANARQLVIRNTDNPTSRGGLSLIHGTSGTGGFGSIYFGSSNASLRGYIEYAHQTDSMQFGTLAGERLRIDSSGRLLVGTTTSANIGGGTAINQIFSNSNGEFVSLHLGYSASAAGSPILALSRSRNTSYGSYTVVQSGDSLGRIRFIGDDGSDYNSIAALIETQVDGTPGTNDMPGRLIFATTAAGASSPTERLRIDSSGNINAASTLYVDASNFRVGIGSASPSDQLTVSGNINIPNSNSYIKGSGHNILQVDNTKTYLYGGTGGVQFRTADNVSPLIDITNEGRFLVGTDTASGWSDRLATFASTGSISVEIRSGTTNYGQLSFSDSTAADANSYAGYIRYDHDINALRFGSNGTERVRILEGGNVLIGQTNGSYGTAGHIFGAGGQAFHINPGDTVLLLNRQNNDGEIVRLSQDGATEGTISVSGSTVSYNGGHLARWSQLPSGAERTEILRGSVLSNIDEMCEWAYEAQDAVLYTEEDELPEGVSVGDVKTPARDAGTEDNEQLNRMKVSDIEGDPNVSGVFQAWDDDDDTYDNDFYCAMTGDFIIRIAQGVTVERGDLLMSAGDGTAKPQDDDIIRSKTIAKVTSTHVSETYADGSYCVPCVLMAC